MTTATTVLRNINSGRITPIIPWKVKAQKWDLEAAEKLKKFIGGIILRSPYTSHDVSGSREFECTGRVGEHNITVRGFFTQGSSADSDIRFALHVTPGSDGYDMRIAEMFEGIPIALQQKATKEVFWDSLKVDAQGVVPYVSIPLGVKPRGIYDLLVGKDAVDAVSGLLKKVNLIES